MGGILLVGGLGPGPAAPPPLNPALAYIESDKLHIIRFRLGIMPVNYASACMAAVYMYVCRLLVGFYYINRLIIHHTN